MENGELIIDNGKLRMENYGIWSFDECFKKFCAELTKILSEI